MIYLITGAAGSLGRRLIPELLRKDSSCVVRAFDNWENGLVRMKLKLNSDRVRYLLGDIGDPKRLKRAMEGVDVCIHLAAQKHVDLAEFNPFFSIQTNVIGTQNVIDAAIDADVDKFLFLSSDKAVEAVGTYGRCKALSESLTVDANFYVGDRRTKLSVARPPNYIGSDASVFDVWKTQKKLGVPITVTHKNMIRYFMGFNEIIMFILDCLDVMKGKEIFVPSNPEKVKIIDLARKMEGEIVFTGLRKGEKLEETLMTSEELSRAEMWDKMWIIR